MKSNRSSHFCPIKGKDEICDVSMCQFWSEKNRDCCFVVLAEELNKEDGKELIEDIKRRLTND